MNVITIRADEVRIGDQLYDSSAPHPFDWKSVRKVVPVPVPVRLEHGGMTDMPGVRICTGAWFTVKTQCEGIIVRRF